MRFSHFFIDRPIFAIVISVFAIILGALAYVTLPVAQYPDVAPPTIQVTASYPGASAEVLADTVATPLEQEINGVEDMIYMSSQSTADGQLTVTVSFKLGTDLDTAQVLVQNRVAIAEPRLPEEVRRIGVSVRKNSPNLMIVVHLYSPDGSRDGLYITNHAQRVRDQLSRIEGVGAVQMFGAREYAMRVWLDPDRIASLNMTAGEVVAAIRSQNIQVASGILGQQPSGTPGAFEVNLQTLGRLVEPGQFESIVVKRTPDGRVTRLRDVARIELGARDYGTRAYLDDKSAVAMPIFQRPGTNALEAADQVQETMQRMSADFPAGLAYDIIYNPTEYISASIDAVEETLFEALVLVVLVVLLFLQSWRAAITPIIAIPVSLIGTFAVMAAFGFSINTLSLFGLVLAIGIVVDDAIIVVENVTRNIERGLSPKEATRQTMTEVSGALVATSLVLTAVFVPTAFLDGLSGQFYRQFALTIATATVLSTLVSLTLSPALAALLLRPKSTTRPSPLLRPVNAIIGRFNGGLDKLTLGYTGLTRRLVRMSAIILAVYGGLVLLTNEQFKSVPGGFIPEQDQGYLITVIQLPPGASLDRTDALVQATTADLLDIDGVAHAAAFAGFNGATFTNETNTAAIFFTFEGFESRLEKGITANAIHQEAWARMGQYQDAQILVIAPPPVRGIGNSGGFKMMLQDRAGLGPQAMEKAAGDLAIAANQESGLVGVFTLFNTSTPQLYADIDRAKAEMLRVPVTRVFEAMEVYVGSNFVNEFNFLGRTYRVTAQADTDFRKTARDVAALRTRSDDGRMVPLGSVATFRDITGPARVPRYNLFPAAAIQGATLPGVSSGEAIEAMERLAADILPDGIGYEWTELSYQEKNTGDTAALAFILAVVFVFLVLAAQYESWALPLAVILIVPMALLFGIIGVDLRGMDNNILVQIGFVVLVGLAAKNAILIVEFARQAEEEDGKDRFEAAIEAARLRLRPILMTSMAFILGVVPLMLASGAAAEMRAALGTVVFSGMLGVTVMGLLFTPVFYVLTRGPETWLKNRTASGNSKNPNGVSSPAPGGV
ncbi:efflux RND transporter permease subunit [Eilatimonas milleporae]|uniref:Efflux pump membrane transporter n=1 Tax=Eilatimonas milleporae TaxID=911205 RepID=A0A3M0CFC4_9PROT|nr:multidrug efflux RND transporter permease subunit [Eilatimonas milleporae]RMB07685.1 HAE1 family hydrophobic/amphiphilic exporter-1 [Eilatimonas milleporae]